MKLEINVPMLPISVNSQYGRNRNKRGQLYLTEEAKIYKHTVNALAWQAVQRQKWIYAKRGTKIKMEVVYTMPKGCRRDIQNDKLTPDALEGIVYDNDNQIVDYRLVKVFGNTVSTKILIETISYE